MRPLLLLLLFSAIAPGLFASAGDTTFYNYVKIGKVVGQEWVVQKDRHHYVYYDEYNDRGRGPAVYTHIQTDNKGIIVSATYSGYDYHKSTVNEKFDVRGGTAYWSNQFEHDSAVYRGQLYSAMNWPYVEQSLILRMLQAAGGGKVTAGDGATAANGEGRTNGDGHTNGEIKLLPSGVLRYRVLTTVHLASLPSLQLVAFTGSGYTPDYFWFTTDGQFFASVTGWFSLIVRGYEGKVDDLVEAQKPYEQQFFHDLSTRMTEKPTGGLAITHTTVFDPESGLTTADQTVLIKDDRIVKVGKVGEVTVPAGCKVIDGTGKFLMPGLWDMHTHFYMDEGPFMLAQGVTNIRDMGNDFELLHIRQLIDDDSVLGPTLSYLSGFIDKAGPMAGPTGVLVNNLPEALQAVDTYKRKGYDQIKLYSSIEPGWVQPIAAKAHGLGMRVCGHIPAYMTASQAVDAGYDEITHINMIVLNFFGDTIDTRNMTRLTLPGLRACTIDVKGAAFQAFMSQLKQHHTVVDPTLSAFEDEDLQLPGELAKAYVALGSFLPAKVRRDAMNSSYIGADSQRPVYARSFANMGKMVKEIYDNGLIVLAGTDGGILQHELELYSQAGIPNAAVLKMATYWPAKVSGKDSVLGTIRAGKLANLVLVDGNPLERMEDIRKISVTIKEGRVYSPKEIYKQFGWGYY